MITTVSKIQFFTAIQAINGMDTVNQGVSADANYPDWVEFNAAELVQVGDPLYVQTQLALGYTSAQMRALCEAGYMNVAEYAKLCEENGWVTWR